jgi:hypothetical protein
VQLETSHSDPNYTFADLLPKVQVLLYVGPKLYVEFLLPFIRDVSPWIANNVLICEGVSLMAATQ